MITLKSFAIVVAESAVLFLAIRLGAHEKLVECGCCCLMFCLLADTQAAHYSDEVAELLNALMEKLVNLLGTANEPPKSE